MNDTFGESARRLAGLATRAFGWTPGQFWQATPAELAAVLAPDDAGSSAPLSRHELETLLKRENHD
jgi:uncharacterized phage protein (TIGR02216 family)